MAKACKCPPEGKGGKGPNAKNAKGKDGKKKPKRKGHPANMFILFFMETWRREGGNMFCMAKVCAERWKNLPQSEKDKYKKKYCELCKKAACKSCKSNGSGGKGSAGKKC